MAGKVGLMLRLMLRYPKVNTKVNTKADDKLVLPGRFVGAEGSRTCQVAPLCIQTLPLPL